MTDSQAKISGKLIAAIIATGLMSFCGVVSETAMNVTFPTLMSELNVNTSTVQWLTTGYLLVLSLVVPMSSYLKRRFSMKSLFLTAISLFIVATVLCAFTPHFSVLLIGRLIQGGATGIALPLMFNIILEQAPKSKIGLLMGVASLITALAPALGPVLGGVIVEFYSWRAIFWVLMPVLLISLLLGGRSITQSSELSRPNFDLPSYLLLVIAFAAFIFATEKAAEYGWMSGFVVGLFATTIVALALFALRSKKQQAPLINLAVFHKTSFALSLSYLVLLQFSVLSLGYLIPNYAQIVTQTNASIAGLLLLPGTLMGAVIAPFSGKALDRFGAKIPVISGSLIIIVATILFASFANHLTTLLFMGFYFIFAIGLGFSSGNTMTHGLRQLSADISADGNAVINTLQQLAGAVGTSISASIVASAQRQYPDNLAQGTLVGSENALYLIFGLSIVAFICVHRLFKTS